LKKLFSSYWIRSAFYSILQRFSIILFGLVNYIVLIRSLPTRQMGTWALFLVVTTIFETTKSSLLKNAHIRFVSSSKENEERSAVASSSILINASITGVFILLILFFGKWLSAWLHEGNDLDDMLKAFIPGLIGMVIFSHMEAVQQSHLDFKGVFAGYFVRQLAFFAIIVLHTILKIPFSLPRLSLYLSGCIFLGAFVIYLYSRPYLLFRFNPSRTSLKNIFNYGGYIFSSGLVANVFSNLDQVLTARFIPDGSSVAYYNAASRISQLIDVPSYAAADILFPKASMASIEEGPGKVRYLYERMVAALLCFTVPTGLFILIFPKLMITIIAGSRYVASAPIIQLYVVTGMVGPMQNQAANLLNSIGKSGLCFLLNTLSLVAKLLINCACLFYIGFYGAAIGSMITASIAAVVWQWVLHKQIGSNVPTIARYMLDFYKTIYGNSRKFILKQ
jgi:O-antigen/teichoic acid export membrane protein